MDQTAALLSAWGRQKASVIGKIVEALPKPRAEQARYRLIGSLIASSGFAALGIFTGMWSFFVGSMFYTGYVTVVWRRECEYQKRYDKLYRLAQASMGRPVSKNSKNLKDLAPSASVMLSAWEPKYDSLWSVQ